MSQSSIFSLLKRLSIYILPLFIILACNEADWTDETSDEELARIRCGSCHLSPEPSLLPKDKWANLLPNMGARLGMKTEGYNPLADKSMKRMFKLEAAGIYPQKPMLSDKEWKRIQAYFLREAPESLELATQKEAKKNTIFEASFPELPLSRAPDITLVKYDRIAGTFYIGNRAGLFGKLNEELGFEYNIRLPMPIVDVAHGEEDWLRLLSIGELYPNESNKGAVVSFRESRIGVQRILADQLPRPVSFLSEDLDGDSEHEFVVCAYGNDIGKFSLLKAEKGRYIETTLKGVPGSSRVFAEDMDKDGQQDLVALFAQGDEGVSIFYHKNGQFREERVLRFHPAFGSSDMEFLDFDGDGDKDIILTNGDNGDYSNVLKPYHGVRIFLNNGKGKFEEQFFYPMYGAAKVRCRDFDLDGDMDLFLMSFFPDFTKNGSQSLLYLENKGNWTFEPYQIEEASMGRWMVMDAGDVDHDGDEDIMLGSFTLNSIGVSKEQMQQWTSSGKNILFLENKTR